MTVILYKERVVKANHSFAKGKLTEKDIEMVVRGDRQAREVSPRVAT